MCVDNTAGLLPCPIPPCPQNPVLSLLSHSLTTELPAHTHELLRLLEMPGEVQAVSGLPLREFSENISIPAGRVGSWDSSREHKETAS